MSKTHRHERTEEQEKEIIDVQSTRMAVRIGFYEGNLFPDGGPRCIDCGSNVLQPTGSCFTCVSCGGTTGCG